MHIQKKEAEILEKHRNGNENEKRTLEFIFGVDAFNQSTFADLDEDEQSVLMAYHRLRKRAEEKRGRWIPDYSNSNQKKYYPYPRYNGSGFVVDVTDFDWTTTDTGTSVGSRLCFPSSEMAIEFFNENIEDYNTIFLK